MKKRTNRGAKVAEKSVQKSVRGGGGRVRAAVAKRIADLEAEVEHAARQTTDVANAFVGMLKEADARAEAAEAEVARLRKILSFDFRCPECDALLHTDDDGLGRTRTVCP